MRGRGTASDPYIITSPAELYAMETVGSPGTYFALGCDIDLGGTPAEETFLPVVFNCRRLDGREFRIRNILSVLHEGAACIFLIPPAAESPALKDLVIENAHLTAPAAGLFGGRQTTVTLEGCRISASLTCTGTASEDFSIFGAPVDAVRCSFMLKIRFEHQQSILSGGSLSRCQFRLDMEAGHMFPGTMGAYPLFENVSASDTYFMGRIKGCDPYRTRCLIFNIVTLMNCYAVLTADGEAYVTDTINTRAATPCFYNNDTGCTGTMILSAFNGLTPAQCRDAAYLRSIGFDCGGGE